MTNYNKPNRADRKKYITEAAAAKKELWDKLSTMEKIKELDNRLGPNVGAKKQRAKLKAKLEAEHAEKEAKNRLEKEKQKKEKSKKS